MKKKICFITLGNLYLCPYLSKYVSSLDCDYDVIYWDRHGLDERIDNIDTYAFDYKMEENASKVEKLRGYISFSFFAKKIIKQNKYNGLILLQTSVSILLASILFSKYRGKYILDIRDYTMEKNKLFYFALEKIIRNSLYTVISSEGYKSFLPKHDYIIVHNDVKINDKDLKELPKAHHTKEEIIISYIGLIRFNEYNKKILLKFKNDKRFVLKFIGKGALGLDEFCKENHIHNVELIDYFPPEETLEHYYTTDIIYNLYGNNNPFLDYALSNKLYYAARLKMPILVCPNTYMEKVSVNNGFGITFDKNNNNELDKLYETYNSIDWNFLTIKSNLFIKKVENENKIFEQTIEKFQKYLSER